MSGGQKFDEIFTKHFAKVGEESTRTNRWKMKYKNRRVAPLPEACSEIKTWKPLDTSWITPPSTFTCFTRDLQAHGWDTSVALIQFSVVIIVYIPHTLSGHNQQGYHCVITWSHRTGRVSRSVGAISGSIKVEMYNKRQKVGKGNK